MDKYERRRLRLIRIKDELCDGNVAELARKLEKADTYVHRMLYPIGKAGKKRIGEDSVDKVRDEFGIDLDESSAPALRLVNVQTERKLQWISDDESLILSEYRACAKPEKDAALALISSLPKAIADLDRSDQGE